MNGRDHTRTALLVLASLLLVVGLAVGGWNEWTTQTCLAQERPPGTYVDCADALSMLLRLGSVGLVLGGVLLLLAGRRR